MSSTSKNKILRLPDVLAQTGLSRSSIYGLMKEGRFKKQIKLGARCVGWLQSDIDDFVAERVAASRPDKEVRK